MPKIIFVNRFFYPDQSATSQLLTDLVPNLNLGDDVEVVVVTSQRVMADPAVQLEKSEVFNSVRVERAYATNFGKKALLARALDFFTFYFSSFFLLLKVVGKNDVVIVKTDPPLILLTTFLVVKLKSAKQINWLQDIYPEVAARLGIKIFNGFIGRIVVSARNSVLKASFCNVVLGEVMASHVASLGVNQEKIRISHNWSDGVMVKPIDKKSNYLVKEWALEGKFIVCYSGNMGRAHEFDTILDMIERLKTHKDIVFLFIGSGANRQLIEEQVSLRNLDNVVFKPYQDFSKLSYSLSVGDVHLISLIPELEGLILPSKLYGVMAAGRPTLFIGSDDGEITRILSQNNCGRSVLIGDVAGLVKEILALYNDEVFLAQLGNNARSEYMKKYDKPVALKNWQSLLSEAIS